LGRTHPQGSAYIGSPSSETASDNDPPLVFIPVPHDGAGLLRRPDKTPFVRTERHLTPHEPDPFAGTGALNGSSGALSGSKHRPCGRCPASEHRELPQCPGRPSRFRDGRRRGRAVRVQEERESPTRTGPTRIPTGMMEYPMPKPDGRRGKAMKAPPTQSPGRPPVRTNLFRTRSTPLYPVDG